MHVSLHDVSYWMDAIRNSKDRDRTLESFWKGQLQSKLWLIHHLEKYWEKELPNIVIHGGWNGVLATLLFNSKIKPGHIVSIDVDPTCEEIATTMNKKYHDQLKFKAITADMTDYDYGSKDPEFDSWFNQKLPVPDVVDISINTSCEHITQEQYDKWLNLQPDNVLLVLQSNNYFDLDEHIRCAENLDDFINQSKINPIFSNIFYPDHRMFNRFMIIGKKRNS